MTVRVDAQAAKVVYSLLDEARAVSHSMRECREPDVAAFVDALAARLEAAETALRLALDCKGPYGGTVSRIGGHPAVCPDCEAAIRAALAAGRGEHGSLCTNGRRS